MFDCDVWVPAELSSTKQGENFFWAGSKEINDSLFVLRHKLLERSFIRSLYSQDSLRSSIHILRIFKLRLGINILYNQ